MEVYKKDGKIVFEYPAEQKRHNPYMPDDADVGTHDTFIGFIERHRENGNDYDNIGFCYRIDMDYKDKPDQWTEIIIRWDGEEKEFKEKCEELGIDVIEEDIN